MNLNRIVLIGRMVRDPELRTTGTGKSVAEFSIAVTKRSKPQQGESDADFFRVKAWGQSGEYVCNYGSKGRLIAVDGRMESRKYVDREGNNREIWEVVADNTQFLDRPRDEVGNGGGAAAANQPAAAHAAPSREEYDPFENE